MQQRSKGAPVSGPLLKEKVLQLLPFIYPEFNVQSFVASSGWLSNGPEKSADHETNHSFSYLAQPDS